MATRNQNQKQRPETQQPSQEQHQSDAQHTSEHGQQGFDPERQKRVDQRQGADQPPHGCCGDEKSA